MNETMETLQGWFAAGRVGREIGETKPGPLTLTRHILAITGQRSWEAAIPKPISQMRSLRLRRSSNHQKRRQGCQQRLGNPKPMFFPLLHGVLQQTPPPSISQERLLPKQYPRGSDI